MKISLRGAMYLCLAIATVTMLSAGSVAAVHTATANNGSGSYSSSNPVLTALYDDGPTNGTVNAFFIDGPGPGPFSQTISDGFIAAASGSVSSMDFGIWVPTGTTPTSVSWALGTSVFGNDVSSGFTPQVGMTFLFSNGFGFDVYTANVTGMTGNLVAGSAYWLTLGDANDSAFTQFDGWDVNGGPASCDFAVGGTPIGDCSGGTGQPEGEAFTLYAASTGVPEPGSLLLLGSGVLGLAGVLRCKLNL